MRHLIESLRARREELFGEARTIQDTANRQRRDLTPSETRAFDAAMREIEELDGRIAELETREGNEGRAVARVRGLAGSRAGADSLTYRPGGEHSFFRDIALRQIRQDAAASERILQHRQEMQREVEFRDLDRVDGAGGEFVPPLWLMDEFAPFARAGRVTADRFRQRALPAGTDSVNIPKISGGTLVAPQTADNAAIADQDATTAGVALPVRTIAGQQDVALQLLEQSPVDFDEIIFADLIEDYARVLDGQVINGSGASGQLQGILGVSGVIAVTYTSATPTVAEIYPKLADGISQMSSQRHLPPECWVMHPRRWAWFLAALDGQDRPLVVPAGDGPMNAAGVSTELSADRPVGRLHGLPVYIDSGIPTNLGAGTNEDRILLLRGSDHLLLEGMLRTRVLPEVGSATLTVRLQVYNYVAATAERFPVSSVVISGTGLATPSF